MTNGQVFHVLKIFTCTAYEFNGLPPLLLSYSVFVFSISLFFVSVMCRALDYAGHFVSFWAHVNMRRSRLITQPTLFAKTGRCASEEVTLHLVKSKCLPILLYGLEACPLTKSNLQSLDFVINRLFMKLFKTSNIDTVKCCQEYFNFDLPSVLWTKRMLKFEVRA